MKGSSSSCLLALLVLAFCALSQARIDDICQLFPEGTVIRDPESCSRSIKCVNSKSTYSVCSGSTPFFNKDTLKCVKTLDGVDDCGVSCVNATSKFINDPKSCFGYYYCADEQTPLYGTCKENQHFSNATQTCIWTQASDCKASEFDYCSIIKNGVNFDNAQGCNRYHVCTKGVLEDKTCKTGYYQASSGKCVDKNTVYCDAHPYPANVCGTVKSPKKN
ncbi:peritrophin-48, partial [Drosophila innubila]|uniref:peritrophin-48 n=1 Tax=Drosophila innubila TaxID=198719 RepID=UPI00148E2074